jgi:uncharacterized protein (UPF0548 family)
MRPLLPRRARALVPGDDGLVPVTVMSAAQADRLREADLTYPEAGATTGGLPPGYHHLHRTVTLGSGAELFTTAASPLARAAGPLSQLVQRHITSRYLRALTQ